MTFDMYRNGRVYVRADLCETCVFRPGNLMRLRPGRLRTMIEEAIAGGSGIVCHETLYDQHPDGHAVCRGFWDRHRHDVVAFRLAQIMEVVEWQE